MKIRRLILGGCAIIFCFIGQECRAQVDAHFSQYYAYPMWLNPGLTGRINGKWRISGNYKRQWGNIATPYQTMALSFDGKTRSNFSLGITILNQTAGGAGYQNLNILGAIAYEVGLDNEKNHIINIGFQIGFVNKRIDPAKFRSGSQWDPILGFDPTASSGEIISNPSILNLDANVGIYYIYRGNNRLHPFGGISLYHLSRPNNSFLKDEDGRLPMRLNIHGGIKMNLSHQFSLTPHFLYLQQGNANEKVGSLYGQYRLNKSSDFILGTTYRVGDAIVPFIGFHLKAITFGLSYDINISNLNMASLNNGGPEISFSYIKGRNNSLLHLSCPRF